MPRRSSLPVLVVPALAIVLSACSDSTRPPGGDTQGTRAFEGSVDPRAGEFVLQSIEIPDSNGSHAEVLLIGRNLRVEPVLAPAVGAFVVLDVAMRNAGEGGLFAPADVVLCDLDPPGIQVIQPDFTELDPARGGPPCAGFLYGDLFGDDRTLSPGEESGARTWRFHLPQLKPFRFGATARFRTAPMEPRIGGMVFWDANENGRREPTEGPAGGCTLVVNGPGIEGMRLAVETDGRYEFPVSRAGMYALLNEPPPTFAPVRFTTPNPLLVVITPGPEGLPRSYLDADFGLANDLDPGVPPVLFHPGPATEIEQDPYVLRSITLSGTILELEVGFSGCGADHPFALYMVAGFMESNPVQASLLLSHDDRGELCDAYWTKTLRFDVRPILQRYAREYGGPGPVLLRFRDYQGTVHTVLLSPER